MHHYENDTPFSILKWGEIYEIFIYVKMNLNKFIIYLSMS